MPHPPDDYIHGHHESVLRTHRWRTAENSAAYFLPRLFRGANVLDVGCGPGTISVGLATRVDPGGVVAIDRSPAVLAEARAHAEHYRQGNVRFAVGDAYQLPLGDGAFDAVHAHQVLQHLGDPVAALAEMGRVCRTGGTVAARDVDYGGMFWFPEDPEMTEWQTLYREVARAIGGEPDSGRRMHRWARTAGFDEIETSAGAWGFATPDERKWWGGQCAQRLTQSSFADRAVATGCAGAHDLERLAEAWRRWASTDDGWFFVPHGEILCRR
jgi:ubiquinone/menaquinone biosynthesis C-methylase UbiE